MYRIQSLLLWKETDSFIVTWHIVIDLLGLNIDWFIKWFNNNWYDWKLSKVYVVTIKLSVKLYNIVKLNRRYIKDCIFHYTLECHT